MGLIHYWFLLAISVAAINASSLFDGLGNNMLSAISKREDSADAQIRSIRRDIPMKRFLHGVAIDNHVKPDEAQKNFAKARAVSIKPEGPAIALTKMPYKKDGVLNYFRRKGSKHDDDSSSTASSSRELGNWKDQWRNIWFGKKLEALNQTDIHGGDKVNMVAARPWGVPCGDPLQHDMPWGSCMLPAECEAEFRIFRGDFKCGSTQFVCCAIQVTSYDQYQAFDVSFASTDFDSDSWEARHKGMSKEKKKKDRDKNKRRRDRKNRKRKIKRMIKQIIKKIKKILNKISKQGTKQRKRKTKLLNNFIKYMKRKYKNDRKSVKVIHYDWMNAIDDHTLDVLLKIKKMNNEFKNNTTYDGLLGNGTLNQALRHYMSDRKRRERERRRRKRRIQQELKKVKNQLYHIIYKKYKHGEKEKKQKAKFLEQYLYYTKHQNLKERKAIQQLCDEWMKAIDKDTLNKLQQFGDEEADFIKNLDKGYQDPIAALLNMTNVERLIRTHPELRSYIRDKARDKDAQQLISKRENIAEKEVDRVKSGRRRIPMAPENLVDDIEYGFMYY